MRCQTSMPLIWAVPVGAPYMGCANHWFTGGSDYIALQRILFFHSDIYTITLLLQSGDIVAVKTVFLMAVYCLRN